MRLALWLAARHRLPAGAIGADPRLRPSGAVSQPGVSDLVAGARPGLGGGACQVFLGGEPDDVPGALRGRVTRRVVAARDPAAPRPRCAADLVPPSQSRNYAATARAAGDAVELVDHFDVIEATDPAWAVVEDWLRAVPQPA